MNRLLLRERCSHIRTYGSLERLHWISLATARCLNITLHESLWIDTWWEKPLLGHHHDLFLLLPLFDKVVVTSLCLGTGVSTFDVLL